ncbi:MAG: L-2-hydroxyglutarate oxidase [Planctomycetaceae bacterium]|nr:L-2-hydroxyglutarate oxidase [Planctomycetaceae bacterium]MBT7255776.1 L-2-hydroxyglutarate oxidase [Planctomycetaceae bacterium]
MPADCNYRQSSSNEQHSSTKGIITVSARDEVIIAGGGIVGMATAYQITQQYPHTKITVLEKESEVGQHQTGRNSGVIHSGIYYTPGSLRATNCQQGRRMMESFCQEQEIPFDICGKVIVAVDEIEQQRLQAIYERGQANIVKCKLLDRDQLSEIEPHTAGIAAIHVPDAGIVNFRSVCQRLAEIVCERGGRIVTSSKVLNIRQNTSSVNVDTSKGDFTGAYLINCTGIYCDRIAQKTGHRSPAKNVPFRGEFYEIKPSAHHLCNHLIYPVPNPEFPFLGVHFTRMIDGRLECGPNAVLAFAREGYRKYDINVRDLLETCAYPGFLRLAAKHWRMGLQEMWRSFSKRAFVKALQRLVPAITTDDLIRGRSGVRAQALAPNGTLVDDFIILDSDRIINVCNAPSPAATSSLKIGETIVSRLGQQFG